MSIFQFSDEELRARFTNWLEKTLFRERIKYLIKSQAHSQEMPLELISREVVPVFSESGCSDDGFYFTNVAISSSPNRVLPTCAASRPHSALSASSRTVLTPTTSNCCGTT